MKNGLPFVLSMMRLFSGRSSAASPSNAESSFSASSPVNWFKPVLQIVALRTPLMPVLGAIRHQQEDTRAANAACEQVEQRLGLLIDPVQVLEDHHDRLPENSRPE